MLVPTKSVLAGYVTPITVTVKVLGDPAEPAISFGSYTRSHPSVGLSQKVSTPSRVHSA